MRRRRTLCAVVVCLWLSVFRAAGEAAPRARVAIDEHLDGPSVLEESLAGKTPPFPLAVRLRVRLDLARAAGLAAQLDGLAERVARHADRGIEVWLVVEAPVPSAEQLDAWSRVIRMVAERAGPTVAVWEIGLTGDPAAVTAALAAFGVKRAAVELGGIAPSAPIVVGGSWAGEAEWLTELYRQDVAPYLGGVAIPHAASPMRPSRVVLEEIAAVMDREDPGALVFQTAVPVTTSDALLDRALWTSGTRVQATSYAFDDAERLRPALLGAAAVGDLLSSDVVRLDEDRVKLDLVPSTAAVAVRSVLLYDTSRFATSLVYQATSAGADRLDVSIELRAKASPMVRDLASGARLPPLAASESQPGTLRITVPLRQAPLVLDFNDGVDEAVTEQTGVTGRSVLSLADIVARHQQARATQDRLVQRYLVLARMEQHFRPTAADPGFDVVSENRFFSDREGVEWEELSFSVNGTRWGADRPPFPLLQPEKVLSLPLDLRLTSDYRYRLEGTAEIDGVPCYVVSFDPADRARSLYRGTVWIDSKTFRQVKLQVVQTALSAPVVSNEEIVRIGAVGRIAGREVYLPTGVTSRQILLIAGRNLLVEKTTSFSGYELNPDDFAERRQAARRSERVMYRDTEQGVRYFVKDGDTRVVSERLTSAAKALAMGTTIDPSYDFPLPVVGLNYLDFDFGGPDSQLALLFGGVLVLGNLQRPKLAGSALDGSLDFFAIAVPGNDRVYDTGGEREEERLLTWPLSTGANLGFQFTSFQKVSAQYQLRFDGYVRDRTTADDFIVPRSTTSHGVGLAYEYRRGGYSVIANGTWFGRARWEPWGDPDAVTRSSRTYTKYGLSVSKNIFLNAFTKVYLNASYFGGRRLDRFSQYQFGLFDDTRIHGVPSSGVRFAELAMVRGAWSFNVFDQYRFDVFLEGAGGRDLDTPSWQRIVGLGMAFNVRAPWSTILRVDAGKSFLPDRYAATGSTVVQILLLKPLQ
jgi:hypothetical protein